MTDTFYIVTKEGRGSSLPFGSCVAALGTFDGVHTAHQSILREAIALKARLGAEKVGAWCFSELPANLLSGKKTPMLCSLEEKIKRILDVGVDFVAVGDFARLSNVSAEDFIDKILIDELHCVGAVCGFNHRFGRGGLGSSELLRDRFGEDVVSTLPEVTMFGETVSSTAIRNHIANGELQKALQILGQPILLKARVIGGKHLGHTIGFPTANQLFPEDIITPARGIYATLCFTEDGKRHIGVSNVGIRPTITDGSDDHVVNCETYICNFNENIYGKMLKVSFCHYLREEKKFNSIKDLCDQIAKDARDAVDIFDAVNIKP